MELHLLGAARARLADVDPLPEAGPAGLERDVNVGVEVLGGLAAAVFGILDYRRIPAGTRANRIGTLHGLGNAAVILLFAVSWWMRTAPDQAPTTNAMLLSLVGAALLLVTGWLGGELVDRLSIGVDERAHVDASNSMSEHGVVEPTTSYKRAA